MKCFKQCAGYLTWLLLLASFEARSSIVLHDDLFEDLGSPAATTFFAVEGTNIVRGNLTVGIDSSDGATIKVPENLMLSSISLASGTTDPLDWAVLTIRDINNQIVFNPAGLDAFQLRASHTFNCSPLICRRSSAPAIMS